MFHFIFRHRVHPKTSRTLEQYINSTQRIQTAHKMKLSVSSAEATMAHPAGVKENGSLNISWCKMDDKNCAKLQYWTELTHTQTRTHRWARVKHTYIVQTQLMKLARLLVLSDWLTDCLHHQHHDTLSATQQMLVHSYIIHMMHVTSRRNNTNSNSHKTATSRCRLSTYGTHPCFQCRWSSLLERSTRLSTRRYVFRRSFE